MPRARPALGLLTALLALSGCRGEPLPQAPADPTPARQFILRQVRFEERRDGAVLWSGTGVQADGDLTTADVTQLTLVRRAQTPGQTEFTLRAPTGHLVFDAGKATFSQARVSEPGGGVLTAQLTRYDEQAGTLVADGPIDFATPTMIASATGAVVWLRQGTVEIAGPVQGELHGAPAPSNSRRPDSSDL